MILVELVAGGRKISFKPDIWYFNQYVSYILYWETFSKIIYEERLKMSNLPGIFYSNLPDILCSK